MITFSIILAQPAKNTGTLRLIYLRSASLGLNIPRTADTVSDGETDASISRINKSLNLKSKNTKETRAAKTNKGVIALRMFSKSL